MRKIAIFCFSLCLVCSAYAKNTVITSLQATYSLAQELTKNTSIEVKSVFGADTSMEMAREAMGGENFRLEKGQKVDAVIDIARVWTDDNLYEKARQNDIRVVEIDASYPFHPEKSTLFFNYEEDGKANPYVWMGTKNLSRMAAIVTQDLARLYPNEAKTLNKNLIAFNEKVLETEKKGHQVLLAAENPEVINLSSNLNYFLNDFNIYAEMKKAEEVTEESAAKIMEETGIKTFVSDRWLKKKVVKAIEAAGGSFVVLNTLNIPMNDSEQMDSQALWKSYQENIEALEKAFQK